MFSYDILTVRIRQEVTWTYLSHSRESHSPATAGRPLQVTPWSGPTITTQFADLNGGDLTYLSMLI
jgi:hypothetical protein